MAAFKIGVMASGLKQPDPAATVAAAGQVGAAWLQVSARAPAGLTTARWADAWRAATESGDVRIASTVTGFPQEDYSSIEAIHRTGGLVPDEAAEDNVRRVIDGADFARALGVDLLTFHAGFIPEHPDDPIFGKMIDRLGRAADAAGERSIRIGLESGQESAAALTRFLAALGRPNVGCNFDPANMILYGRQEPIEAVETLSEHIFQVHAKDAVWSEKPGELWGKEVPVGTGAVGFDRFVSKLRSAGFDGVLIIEREAGEERIADIAAAVKLLQTL